MTQTPPHTAVVIAAHGAPATDYPPARVGMQMMLEFAGRRVDRIGPLRRWRERLARQASAWPRTPDNDPYKRAVEDLAGRLSARLGCPVVAGYNEFCAPGIGEAIDAALAGGARTVAVVPTMILGGNSHTEVDIHEAVTQARARHPQATIHYAWPFDPALLADLLAGQVSARLGEP